MTPPAPRDGPTESYFRGRDERGPDRRVVAVAFAVSVALHLAAILLYPVLTAPRETRATAPVVAGETPPPVGTEIVRIVEMPDDALEEPEEPDEPDEVLPRPPAPAAPARPVPARDRPGAPDTDADEDDPGPTAAERILATTPDIRLVMPLPDDVTALSQEQIAQLELIWALAVSNDSAAVAAARARALTDWTYTDEQGRRWGPSEQGLHLGDYTIPLPNLGAPYDPEAWKGSLDAVLERGAASAAARDANEDRARAIRERRDRERSEPPDTAGGRRGGGGGGSP